jgi:hypothetical protein
MRRYYAGCLLSPNQLGSRIYVSSDNVLPTEDREYATGLLVLLITLLNHKHLDNQAAALQSSYLSRR